jgi:hypothetical protein
MLSQIEQKLTSLIADRLVERTHLSVIEAPGPVPALQAGKGAVLVSLAEVSPESTFERARFKINGTQSRRILPIAFAAEVELFMQPAGATDAERANARETLLDDMALTCHRLAQDDLLDGSAFAVADPDPGFKVRAFLLENAAIRRDENPNGLSAVARYRGSGEIWPPGVVQPAGEIRAIDTLIVPLPMQIDARDATARPGQSVAIHVRSLGGNRLMVREPRQTQPLQIAVTVLSDAPPAHRGSITGGTLGVETGFRIIDLTPPDTRVPYQAPVAASVTRTRMEYVAIHLAAPDRKRGVFLGSAAIRLEPAA